MPQIKGKSPGQFLRSSAACRSAQSFTRIVCVVIFVFISLHSIAQALSGSQILSDLRHISYCLADDSMGGRQAGSLYDMKAAKIISGYYRSIHLKPFRSRSFLHSFHFPGDSGNILYSQNVLGRCGNKKGPIILIGAHFDHIGFGGHLSRNPLKKEVHNGADDNASGVAVMLELAKAVTKIKRTKYSYVFAAFSAHEVGLFGSRNMVHSNVIDTSHIILMINLDMLGRMDTNTNKLFYSCNRSWCDSILMKTELNSVDFSGQGNRTPALVHKELPLGDHSAFDSVHIPVMYFTTGMHDDYHKVTDDPELLQYKGMAQIVKYLFTLVNNIETNGLLRKESH